MRHETVVIKPRTADDFVRKIAMDEEDLAPHGVQIPTCQQAYNELCRKRRLV